VDVIVDSVMTELRDPTAAPVFLTAEWLHLVLLNYVVPPALLEPLVPRGTELDLWHGEAYVSVVGFVFANTRVRGVAIPFHQTFEEVNLRFYVKRRVDDDERRAVTFVRELVPRLAIAVTARLMFNEPYLHLAMSHQLDLNPSAPTRAEYRWTSEGASSAVVGDGWGEPAVPAADSEEAFMTQRHWGYTRQRDGSTVEYYVAHPVWGVSRIGRGSLDGDPTSVFGPDFAAIFTRPPSSAFFADGSAVAVHDPVRLE
jgi:uncharacterized protein